MIIPEPFPALPSTKLTLMVVDDDEDLLLVMRMALIAHGFNVLQSVSGLGLFGLLKAHRTDLVLLDIAMDGVSGKDICKAIRKHPDTMSLPVLLFSANRDIDEIARECGADGFIKKPFELSELTRKIKSLVSHTGLQTLT